MGRNARRSLRWGWGRLRSDLFTFTQAGTSLGLVNECLQPIPQVYEREVPICKRSLKLPPSTAAKPERNSRIALAFSATPLTRTVKR